VSGEVKGMPDLSAQPERRIRNETNADECCCHFFTVEHVGRFLTLETETNLLGINKICQSGSKKRTSSSALLAQSPLLGVYGAHSTDSPTADKPIHCLMILEGPRCLGGSDLVGSRLERVSRNITAEPGTLPTYMTDKMKRSLMMTNSTSGGKSPPLTTSRFVNANASVGQGAMPNLNL
jgi:hypothetical protein